MRVVLLGADGDADERLQLAARAVDRRAAARPRSGVRVRSPLGPLISSSPMLETVTISSATTLRVDLGGVVAALEEQPLPASCPRILRGSLGSKIIEIASQLVTQPMIVPSSGSTHQYGNAWTMKIVGMPHAKPKKKPKLMMNFSSRSPTSRNMRLDSSGRFSRWRMTISLTSSSWSMLPPIRSTTTSWTMPGSSLLDAVVDGLRGPAAGGRATAAGARSCIVCSTRSRMSSRDDRAGCARRAPRGRATRRSPTRRRSWRSSCRRRSSPSSPRGSG